jgi:hypothetical protein
MRPMSKTQEPAPAAKATTTRPSSGRRSRAARNSAALPTTADPVAEAMRAQAVAAVTGPPDEPEDFDGKAVLTLEQLIERHGQATVAEADSYLEGATIDQLTSDGTAVSTTRITRDGSRLWGTISAFLLRATPAQRAYIPAITDDFVRIGIWSTYRGQLTFEALENAGVEITSARTGRQASSKDMRRQGGERRDVLYNGLRILVGRKSELLSRIEQVYRRSTQPTEVANSLRALVKIGREALADASPAAVQRRRGSLITAEFLTESETLAADVETSGKEAAAVPEPSPVSQADVDLWDGRNLVFLELAIDAFEAGHAIDPSIPRLVPISLRNILGPRRRASRSASPPSTPSTPQSPTSPAPGRPSTPPSATTPPPSTPSTPPSSTTPTPSTPSTPSTPPTPRA